MVRCVSKIRGEIETKGVEAFTGCEAKISRGEVEMNLNKAGEVNESPGDESEEMCSPEDEKEGVCDVFEMSGVLDEG